VAELVDEEQSAESVEQKPTRIQKDRPCQEGQSIQSDRKDQQQDCSSESPNSQAIDVPESLQFFTSAGTGLDGSFDHP